MLSYHSSWCFFISILILVSLIIGLLTIHFSVKKRLNWLKLSIVIFIIIVVVINLLMFYIVSKNTDYEKGKINVQFKDGVELYEINITLEKYGYSIITIDYNRIPDSNQTSYFAIVKVPQGEEEKAIKNLEGERIVSYAYIPIYLG